MNKFLETMGVPFYNLTSSQIINMLVRDCRPWLLESKGQLVYRGEFNENQPEMVKKTVRTNRQPVDTPKEAHDAIVELIRKLGFIANRDNSIFVSASALAARGYGDVHVIFPIGNYSYTWGNDVWDMYADFTREYNIDRVYNLSSIDANRLKTKLNSFDPNTDADMRDLAWIKRQFYLDQMNSNRGTFNIDEIFKIYGHKFSNRNLLKAIELRVEIMIACEYYYAISLSMWKTISGDFETRNAAQWRKK